MGVDTKAVLNGHISPREILYFIKKEYDPDAYIAQEKVEEHSIPECIDDAVWVANSEKWITEIAFISFSGPNYRMRNMFVFFSTMLTPADAVFCDGKIEKIAKEGVTYASLSLDSDGFAADVMLKLAEYFGGWYTENDCAAEYKFIRKKLENMPRPTKNERTDAHFSLLEMKRAIENIEAAINGFTPEKFGIYDLGPFEGFKEQVNRYIEWISKADEIVFEETKNAKKR